MRGSYKVQPADVVQALEKHPAVREAAVTALADPHLGALPVAAIEAVPGQPPPSPAELHLHCRHVLEAAPNSPARRVPGTARCPAAGVKGHHHRASRGKWEDFVPLMRARPVLSMQQQNSRPSRATRCGYSAARRAVRRR
ncbi:AMP-binding enzyme [Micromonospora sp. LOL_024]|uniref:AMP-binding enzyme n=1 Tax=Micromonospora sp. LOL_024 TaxID=3345412 RepID=UPI003A84EB09